MLVVQGTADDQVPAPLTDGYVSQMACAVGDTIEYVHYPGAGHDQVTFEAVPRIVAWAAARLRGDGAPSTCGRSWDGINATTGGR
jgi:hypothetical protein